MSQTAAITHSGAGWKSSMWYGSIWLWVKIRYPLKLWMVNTKLDMTNICGPLNGLPFWPTSIYLLWYMSAAVFQSLVHIQILKIKPFPLILEIPNNNLTMVSGRMFNMRGEGIRSSNKCCSKSPLDGDFLAACPHSFGLSKSQCLVPN